MIHPTIAHIDLAALRHNVAQIKQQAPHSKILAMVKANAYGHGAVEVSHALENYIDAFGVIFLKEAHNLFATGIKKPIVILSGFFDADELQEINQCGFATVIHNFEQLAIFEQAPLAKPQEVWLKIDTGMHRLGFQPAEVAAIYAKLMQHPQVIKPLHLMTHFSDADDRTKAKTLEQLACFTETTRTLEGIKSLANSSAILNFTAAHGAWVRPGITLHGVSPISEQTGKTLNLRPVMTLTSRLITTHDLHKGDTVGYGGTWVCPEDMRIGIVAIGYGDGYPRNSRQGAPILINGVRCPLIGKVAMDMTTVDLRPLPSAKVGDTAILWGRGLPIEEVARFSEISPYEMFSRITQRVLYKYYARSDELKIKV